MKACGISKDFYSLGGKLLLAFALMFSLNISTAWAESQDCGAFGDATLICAPISQVTLMAGNSAVAAIPSGATTYAATVSTSASSLKFAFTSNSANASKRIYLQFFDISPGLSLTLPGDKCEAAQIASHGCVAAVDDNGSVTIPVTVSGMGNGKVFKYQINGPAGFTSGFVVATYASGGGTLSTPEACSGDTTTICAPITRLTMSSGSKNIPITYDTGTHDGVAYIPTNTSSIDYKFTFPADYANKYVFVAFFDATDLNLSIAGGSINSSTSCDPQPAATGGCKLEIDSTGKATFTASLAINATGANFKYKIAGPNYDSNIVQVTFGSNPNPSPSSSPIVRTSATMTPGKGKFTLTVRNGRGKTATVGYTIGHTTKTVHVLITKNSAQAFSVNVKKGAYKVRVSIGSYRMSANIRVR